MKTIAFFNNKGGVGKTTLVYHLAHMLPRLGHPTLALDLDPQANLSSAFFDDDQMELFWQDDADSIMTCIRPILEGTVTSVMRNRAVSRRICGWCGRPGSVSV